MLFDGAQRYAQFRGDDLIELAVPLAAKAFLLPLGQSDSAGHRPTVSIRGASDSARLILLKHPIPTKICDDLAREIETLLRTTDALGLSEVGIYLNNALLALGREGLVPPLGDKPSVMSESTDDLSIASDPKVLPPDTPASLYSSI